MHHDISPNASSNMVWMRCGRRNEQLIQMYFMIKAFIQIHGLCACVCVCLRCTIDTHRPCRYMNIVMKHLSMMHFLLFVSRSIHFIRILSRLFSIVAVLFSLNSPHGMRMCCSLSIDSFCDFYSHFRKRGKQRIKKTTTTNHLPMCRVFASFHSWALSWTVFCPFSHTTHHFVSMQFLLVHTKCIHDLH